MVQDPKADEHVLSLFGEAAALTAFVSLLPGATDPRIVPEAKKIIESIKVDGSNWSHISKEAALATLDEIADLARKAPSR